MIDEDFRTVLHDRLGPALDALVAPDLLSGVRARQAKHKRSVRAGLALSAAASVTAVVVAAAVWPSAASVPASVAASTSSAQTPRAAVAATPVAPVVTSGRCAGLSVTAYQEPRSPQHPPVRVARAGTVLTLDSDFVLGLVASGPCADRLSYVPRTAAVQGGAGASRQFSFVAGQARVIGQAGAANRTGVVQLFLDCTGLVCSGSGVPLATFTIHERGSAAGAASRAFPPAPTVFPLSEGPVVVVPSVVGLPLATATRDLARVGLEVTVGFTVGTVDTGKVTVQDLPAGSRVVRGTEVSIFVPGPFPGRSSSPSAVPVPSLIGLTIEQARSTLAKAGIAYLITFRFRPEAANTVTFQNPKAGVAVLPRSAVQLTVSLGPVPKK